MVASFVHAGGGVRTPREPAPQSRTARPVYPLLLVASGRWLARPSRSTRVLRRRLEPHGPGVCRRRAEMGQAGRGSRAGHSRRRRTHRQRAPQVPAGNQRRGDRVPAVGTAGHRVWHDEGV